MTGVYLDRIRMKRQSKSFTDSLYAVLTAGGLFEGPKHMLSGLSGMAFKLSVHERLLPMSVSAYGQWGIEHAPAVRNLGLFTAWGGDRSRHPTFRYYQKDAVEWVKNSLEKGLGVIYWIPEFGVIHGYDEEDRVFYLQDGRSDDSQVVLYDNIGINFTGFWYIQSFGGKVAVPQEDMILESLRLAIDDWDTPHKTLPDTQIGSGRLAYSFLIRGLQSGDYDEDGAVYILDSYLYSRLEVMQYLSDVRSTWKEIGEAAHLYDRLVETVSPIKDCMTGTDGTRRVIRARIPEIAAMLAEALSLEEQAVDLFRFLSRQYPDPRRTTITRWGTSSPR